MNATAASAVPGTIRRTARAAVAAVVVGTTALVVLLTQMPVVAAQPGQTTSTLPVDNRELGNSLPKPNRGATPQDAGDPGGWLQVSLFFLICAAVVLIAGAVWWQSRRARQRRDAAGFDPVDIARRNGQGVRAPVDPSARSIDAS